MKTLKMIGAFLASIIDIANMFFLIIVSYTIFLPILEDLFNDDEFIRMLQKIIKR